MRILYLVCTVLVSLDLCAAVKIRTSRARLYEKEKSSSFGLGKTSLELGVNYSSFKDGQLRKTYRDFYRTDSTVMPSFRVAQFFELHKNFNVGLGFQISYFRRKAPTWDENDNYHSENQVLVYIPYQVFLDLNLTSEKGFDFDVWGGYKESFIENRREAAEGPAYISRMGKHWNSFVTLGVGSSFSLRNVSSRPFFKGRYPYGFRDILIKFFYETDFNLNNERLLGNREVLKNNNYEQRTLGVGFLFKL